MNPENNQSGALKAIQDAASEARRLAQIAQFLQAGNMYLPANLSDLLVDGFEKPDGSNFLWAPKHMENDSFPTVADIRSLAMPLNGITYFRSFYGTYGTGFPLFEPEPCAPNSEPFETNMMEALVGWRAWKVDPENKLLQSQYDHVGNTHKAGPFWYPEQPMVASCHKEKHESPAEFCSCGVYALDTLDSLLDKKRYEGVRGEVYGWGRYVRGDQGWRAQYCYPKRFYITADYARDMSPDVLDILRSYRVPIVIEQPVSFYNPEEDGYANRETDTNWNCGAAAQPDADEAGSPSDDSDSDD